MRSRAANSPRAFTSPPELIGILAPYFSPELRDLLAGEDAIHFGALGGNMGPRAWLD